MTLSLHAIPDRDALLGTLAQIDLKVARRTRGRTPRQRETWTICRLLSTLTQADRIEFPLTAAHQNRPNIWVQMGNAPIGIEVTEAVDQQFAEYSATAEREYPKALLDLGLFRLGAPKRTVREMRILLSQDRLTSDGWAGDDPEREWAGFIQSVVNTKLDKLAAPEFRKGDRNWLAIYDNLPRPQIDLDTAVGHLRPLLECYWSRQSSFDALFVEHGTVIMEITSRWSAHHVLNNAWR